jgi:pimeloyl-ACP methyl ester carboxylesterase
VTAGPSPSQRLADAWQVMYHTTDALGQPSTGTGTVLTPKEATADTPLVGFAPGTQGISFECAPSRMIQTGAFYEQPAIDSLLRAGYAVAVPDYEGYHENPAATYVTGRSMGAALIDVVRAAQQLPDAGLAADGPVAFRGYSQGGGATMWAAQMHDDYAPELDLVGVAGGGVPANLAQVAFGLDGKGGFGFMAISLIGFDNAYPELDLDDFLTEDGREAFGAMTNGDCALDLLLSYANADLLDYTNPSPFTSPAWLRRITENELGRAPINVPVFHYHATTDGIVPFPQARQLQRTYCTAGVELTWKEYDTSSLGASTAAHTSPISWANDEVMEFLADRFAGRAASTTC